MTEPVTGGTDAESRAPFPKHWLADVLLTDGGVAALRPISPDDADRLIAFHAKLSERTRYLRYFGPYPTMSQRDLKRFTTVDHKDRVAFVAVLGDEIIAVGRYERLLDVGDGRSAEVAFVVADAHQGRGLGPILLEHLAAAAAENGLTMFVAEVLAENRNMVTVFREAGYQVSRTYEGGVLRLEFAIDPTETLVTVRNSRERATEARSVRNLLSPQSVALIGASTDAAKVGNAVLRNLLGAGFTGPVYPVNAENRSVRGCGPTRRCTTFPTTWTSRWWRFRQRPSTRSSTTASRRASRRWSWCRVGSATRDPTDASPSDGWCTPHERTGCDWSVPTHSVSRTPARPFGSTPPSRPNCRRRAGSGSSASPARSASRSSTRRRAVSSVCPPSSRRATAPTSPETIYCSTGTRTPRPRWCCCTWRASATHASSPGSRAGSAGTSRSWR
ncbi:acetyltransferase family protein [Rhodococcus sp. MTM3W5.2]|nr:acetyltransferase family protein [Rhodococcus sp. MTM3W5.2]